MQATRKVIRFHNEQDRNITSLLKECSPEQKREIKNYLRTATFRTFEFLGAVRPSSEKIIVAGPDLDGAVLLKIALPIFFCIDCRP